MRGTRNFKENGTDIRQQSWFRHREGIVDRLKQGGWIIFVTDHDPRSLYRYLESQRDRLFFWSYLERGPTRSRIEISCVRQMAPDDRISTETGRIR
ncbi:MAG: DUF2249 domain-containing protein [Xanthobacteraceae bacterium]|nr:DUF2249 domain-containing protein [Xanthobacteraceae bacterium]